MPGVLNEKRDGHELFAKLFLEHVASTKDGSTS